jgi:phosphate transport system ATP-binding protein
MSFVSDVLHLDLKKVERPAGDQPESILEINNLNVSHLNHHILKDINLKIPKGRITTFLGPSGCGKTTLLKSINRLTDLHSDMKVTGSIRLGGKEILNGHGDLPDLRQKMGLLSQRPFPLPMNIFDNVAFGLKIQGIKNRTEIANRVEFHLKQVALWDEVKDRLKSPATKLSIGQQQRLCLARGLAVNPEVILADEPTSALDPISSRKIEEQFQELKKHYTIILVTHILRQTVRLADNIVFMYMGEVVEQGSSYDIFQAPKSDILKNYLNDGH